MTIFISIVLLSITYLVLLIMALFSTKRVLRDLKVIKDSLSLMRGEIPPKEQPKPTMLEKIISIKRDKKKGEKSQVYNRVISSGRITKKQEKILGIEKRLE